MQVDLKPKELFEYNGISPKPDDFDDFWDTSIEGMRKIDPSLELVPCKWEFSGVDAYDMYFTGVDNARIHAKYMRPVDTKKCPAVFMFHGYSEGSDGWAHLLSYASQGYCVAALDCRGQGGISEDRGGVIGNTIHGHIIRGLESDSPKDLLFTKIFLDVVQLVDIVEKFDEIDENKLFAKGCSQGGALTYVCASLCPQIKAASAGVPFLSDYKRVWEMDMDVRAYAELKDFFRHTDPRHEKEDETFMKLGYIDIQNMANRIKGKMLMFTGLMDNVCPPSTQFAAFNKITSEKKVLFYPDFAHEYFPEYDELTMQWFKSV